MYKATKGYVVLRPSQIRLEKEPMKTEGLTLTLLPEAEGEEKQVFPNVQVRRAFPLSEAQLITFCAKDGNEIGVLWDDSQLDEHSRQVLKRELELAYFVPRVTKINRIKDEYGITHWDVDTDRGPRRFEVSSRYDIRLLPGRRLMIRDMDGNRYEIADFELLDRESRDLLELEI